MIKDYLFKQCQTKRDGVFVNATITDAWEEIDPEDAKSENPIINDPLEYVTVQFNDTNLKEKRLAQNVLILK